MKFFLFLLTMAGAGWLAQLILPWPAIALVGLLIGAWTGLSVGRNFVLGFLAGFLVWGIQALVLNAANDGLLAGRIGELFMGIGTSGVLILTACIGGLLGGLGCATGSAGVALFSSKPA